jgi:hypothetical protein
VALLSTVVAPASAWDRPPEVIVIAAAPPLRRVTASELAPSCRLYSDAAACHISAIHVIDCIIGIPRVIILDKGKVALDVHVP